MENRIYEEAALRTAYESVDSALKTVQSELGAEPGSVAVYIVRNTLTGSPQTAGGSVFCTPDDLESGEYLAALLGAGYGLDAKWQREGLAAYLKGGAADESGLAEFFSDPDNALAASLSPLFMDAELAGDDTADTVMRAAASLAAFAIKNKGFEAFRASGDTAPLLTDWLKNIGAKGDIALPEGSAGAADMEVTHERGCICVCRFDRFTVYAGEDGFAQTPGELYSLACGVAKGTSLLAERFAEETPSLSELINERFDRGITIRLADSMTANSYAYPEKAEVYLTKPTAFIHETVHVLLAENAPEEMCWMREALAEYYSHDASGKVFPEYDLQQGYEGYLEFFAGLSGREATEDDLVFHRTVWALCERLRSPEIEAEGRDDTHAYELAYGISSLLLDDIDRTQIRFKYDRTVGYGYNIPKAPKETAGNQLSYPESLAVFEYLAGIYGAEKLTKDQLDGLTSIESVGMTWPEIFAAAKEYYEKEYGELIPRD